MPEVILDPDLNFQDATHSYREGAKQILQSVYDALNKSRASLPNQFTIKLDALNEVDADTLWLKPVGSSSDHAKVAINVKADTDTDAESTANQYFKDSYEIDPADAALGELLEALPTFTRNPEIKKAKDTLKTAQENLYKARVQGSYDGLKAIQNELFMKVCAALQALPDDAYSAPNPLSRRERLLQWYYGFDDRYANGGEVIESIVKELTAMQNVNHDDVKTRAAALAQYKKARALEKRLEYFLKARFHVDRDDIKQLNADIQQAMYASKRWLDPFYEDPIEKTAIDKVREYGTLVLESIAGVAATAAIILFFIPGMQPLALILGMIGLAGLVPILDKVAEAVDNLRNGRPIPHALKKELGMIAIIVPTLIFCMNGILPIVTKIRGFGSRAFKAAAGFAKWFGGVFMQVFGSSMNALAGFFQQRKIRKQSKQVIAEAPDAGAAAAAVAETASTNAELASAGARSVPAAANKAAAEDDTDDACVATAADNVKGAGPDLSVESGDLNGARDNVSHQGDSADDNDSRSSHMSSQQRKGADDHFVSAPSSPAISVRSTGSQRLIGATMPPATSEPTAAAPAPGHTSVPTLVSTGGGE